MGKSHKYPFSKALQLIFYLLLKVEDVNNLDWFHEFHYLKKFAQVRTNADSPLLHPFYGYNSPAQEYPYACNYQ